MDQSARIIPYHSAGLRLALAGTLLVGAIAPAAAEETLRDALTKGEVSLDVRYRFEFVDEDGIVEDAKASTLRTRLGYKTGTFRRFFAFTEFKDVRVIACCPKTRPIDISSRSAVRHRLERSRFTGLWASNVSFSVTSGEPNHTLGETLALWLTGGAQISRRISVGL